MSVTIAIFERRSSAGVLCVTLGLGPDTRQRVGKNPRKAEAKLIEDLQRWLRKTPEARLPDLEPPRGTKLVRVRLQLSLDRKVAGRYPFIIEPRWTCATEKRWFVYHPNRQTEVVAVAPDEPMEPQLRAYFQHVWADLDDEELHELESRGKERLYLLTVACSPRSIMEELPEDSPALREGGDPARKKHRHKGPRVLADLGVDLTEQAARGDLSLGASRGALRDSLASLLSPERSASVLLVGPSRAGKTTLVHQLVADLLSTDGFETHQDLERVRHVWCISGRRLIAGMSRMGEWEKRCVDLMEDARRKVILYVDDIEAFGRIGRSRESDRALADVLRPAIAGRDVVVMGECTVEQVRVLEQQAPAFAGSFLRLRVPEATREETLRLMVHQTRDLEVEHAVAFHPHTLRALVDAGESLLSHQALPGKVIDLQRDLARMTPGTPAALAEIHPSDVLRLLSRRTGVPELLLSGETPVVAEQVERELAEQVMGQSEAVRVAADLVAKVKTRMVDPARPYGVYLFTGPTGVGKTELAKALAAYLYGSESRMVRFDMAEFGGWDAPARLVGDRYRPDGGLTRRLREQPFSLVLFDEIEKAHPMVHNLLLQIFEDGRLTDASGRTASFQHAVVVMTSNLGARPRAPVGYGGPAKHAWMHEIDAAVRAFFSPELFNRIDRIVPFEPLDDQAASRIAAKELRSFCQRRGLADRHVFLQIHDEVAEHIAKIGFSPSDGARSVKRAIDSHVGGMLSDVLSREAPSTMQLLRMGVRPEGLGIDRQVLREAAPQAVRWRLQPLLSLPRGGLLGHVIEVGKSLRALTDGDELGRLSDRLRADLEALNLGDASRADSIYDLDAMRASLAAFLRELDEIAKAEGDVTEQYERLEADRFAWVTHASPMNGLTRRRMFDRRSVAWSGPRAGREDLIVRLAEGYSLQRSVAMIDDPRQHAVVVELERVAELSDKRRFEDMQHGLMEELFAAYLAESGVHAKWTLTMRDDSVVEGAASSEAEVAIAVQAARLALRISLHVVRPCALDLFGLETGVHVWNRARGPDLVAVRVRSCADSAELDACDRGVLPPVVRTVRFEPPLRPGTLATMDVEDYAMAFVEVFPARRLADAFAPLWLLRRGGFEGEVPS
jgi:ATP-dependent Clp protease ATP-binding subunit ClpA/ATP-dependent Clp protease ATP-binding subunit ClpC